jgi:hypothetical protein
VLIFRVGAQRRSLLPIGVLAVCAILGCATGSFEGSVFRDSETAYRVGPLDPRWHRFDLSDANLAFHDDAGGTILANAFCSDISDVPLDVLTNQALMGLEQKQETAREVVTLDGRSALKTRLSATLDGVPVDLELVVTKKDGCTYDFELVTGTSGQTFADREPGFWQFVEGFQQLPKVN